MKKCRARLCDVIVREKVIVGERKGKERAEDAFNVRDPRLDRAEQSAENSLTVLCRATPG